MEARTFLKLEQNHRVLDAEGLKSRNFLDKLNGRRCN